MDGIDQIKDDAGKGRIDPQRLVDLIVALERELQAARRELEAAKQRIQDLEKKAGGSATTKIDEPFSMRAEEQRQEARGKKRRDKRPRGRCGRVTTAEKVKQAERTETVFP